MENEIIKQYKTIVNETEKYNNSHPKEKRIILSEEELARLISGLGLKSEIKPLKITHDTPIPSQSELQHFEFGDLFELDIIGEDKHLSIVSGIDKSKSDDDPYFRTVKYLTRIKLYQKCPDGVYEFSLGGSKYSLIFYPNNIFEMEPSAYFEKLKEDFVKGVNLGSGRIHEYILEYLPYLYVKHGEIKDLGEDDVYVILNRLYKDGLDKSFEETESKQR